MIACTIWGVPAWLFGFAVGVAAVFLLALAACVLLAWLVIWPAHADARALVAGGTLDTGMCPACHGSGLADTTSGKCTRCLGHGWVWQ